MGAQITLDLIKQVRSETGAGMMEVKKALSEADGDINRAKEILRAKGVQAAGKREGRKAQEGMLAAKVIEENGTKWGYVIELNSETDFVAKNEKFDAVGELILEAMINAHASTREEILAAQTPQGTVEEVITEAGALFKEHIKLGQFGRISGHSVDLYAHRKSAEFPPSIVAMIATDHNGESIAHDVALQISAMSPQWLSQEDVPESIIDRERRIATEKSLEEGKPEKILPMIIKGRLQAFYEETVLLDQKYVKDPKVTIGDLFESAHAKAEAFLRIEVGKGEEQDPEITQE